MEMITDFSGYLNQIEGFFIEAETTARKETIEEGEFIFWNTPGEGLFVSFGDSELSCFHRQSLHDLCDESLGFLLERQLSKEQREEADGFVEALEELASSMRQKLNRARVK